MLPTDQKGNSFKKMFQNNQGLASIFCNEPYTKYGLGMVCVYLPKFSGVESLIPKMII